MDKPADALNARLVRLVRRERLLILAKAGLGGAAAAALASGILAALVSQGWAAPGRGAGWLLAAGVGVIVASARPLLAWRAAANLRRQAEAAEAAEPALRGELLTSVDRLARPMGSAALLARVVQRAEAALARLPVERVRPWSTLRRHGAAAAGGLFAVLVAAGFLPVGPVEAVQILLTPVVVNPVEAPRPDDGPRALVGDITLRYLYPTYTRLEPLEVPNSSGEVRAPPGTRVEVRARAAQAHASAALELVLPDGAVETLEAELQDGRDLRAAFEVRGPGAWRFRFPALPSPDYPVVPDPDLAPDVSLAVRARTLTLPLDGAIDARWAARDDYGVQKVVAEVVGDGPRREVLLREPLQAPRELDESASISARQLGLSAGSRVKLRVGAYDNDAVSGSKAGWSAVVDVEVVGPRGRSLRDMETRRRLRDLLVLVLADFLVEPAPAYADGAGGPAWAVAANERYAEVDALVREAWGGVEGTGVDQAALAPIQARRRELFAFARGGGALAEADAATLVGLQERHIEAVEGGVLLLSQVLRAQATRELSARAAELAERGRQLADVAKDLTREEALARLDTLERLLAQLVREAARMGDPAIEEFVNQRAGQLDALMDEIRRALGENRMEDARKLLERLAEQLAELSEGLAESQRQQGEADDQLGKAMAALKSELESLQQEQEALREEANRAREGGDYSVEEAQKRWEEAERRTRGVLDALRMFGPSAAAEGVPGGVNATLGDARAETEGLLDSIRARNLSTSLDRVDRAEAEVAMFGAALEAALRRGASTLGAVRGPAATQRAELARVRTLLEQLVRQQMQASPQTREQLQQLASRQQELAERAAQAADRAAQVARSLPMKAPGLAEGADQGAKEAGRAAGGLEAGDPMEATGGQQAAADGFREALDALDQAQDTLQQMQQAASGQREASSGGGQGNRDGENADATEEIALPAPEEFATPEAYRRALLEGMSGQVPDEYRTLNRRYYEELVRQ